jgi:dolichyl-phosphate-mannose--protein O-mannosyl transferase
LYQITNHSEQLKQMSENVQLLKELIELSKQQLEVFLEIKKEVNQLSNKIDLIQVNKEEENDLNYGDIISLKHVNTKMYLHSHENNYYHQYSSKQQQVTAIKGVNNSIYFEVLAKNGILKEGKVLAGDTICLRHVNTKKHLHSHIAPSPETNQQEVTCFEGEDSNGILFLF